MTKTQLRELLTKTKPGYKILIRPDLTEFIANTNHIMTQYAGTWLTVNVVYCQRCVYVNEDHGRWEWDYNHIIKVLPPKRLKRKPNG